MTRHNIGMLYPPNPNKKEKKEKELEKSQKI